MAGYGYSYGGYPTSNGLGPSYAPNQNNGQYYTANKTESYSPLLNEYRQRSPVRYRQPSNPVPYQQDRYSPANSSYWNQTQNSYQVDTTGDWRSGEWSKPKGTMINNGVSDAYYRKSETDTKPEINNAGGWPRPNKAMWATPPESETSLRKPTTDISTAFEFMKEAAKASGADSSNSRYAIPASTGSRMHGKTGAVDGNEGQRRYGNLNFLSRAKEAYKGGNEVYKGIGVMQSAAKK